MELDEEGTGTGKSHQTVAFSSSPKAYTTDGGSGICSSWFLSSILTKDHEVGSFGLVGCGSRGEEGEGEKEVEGEREWGVVVEGSKLRPEVA